MTRGTGGVQVYTPAYGSLRRALEFLVLVVVVATALPSLTGLLSASAYARWAPRVRVGAWLLVAAWGLFLLVLEVRRQRRLNPVTGASRAEAIAPLRRRRVPVLAAIGATVLGGVLVVGGWWALAGLLVDPTGGVAAVDRAARAFNRGRFLAFLGSDLVRATGGIVGLVALPFGLDRTVVALVRESQYRWYRWRTEADHDGGVPVEN